MAGVSSSPASSPSSRRSPARSGRSPGASASAADGCALFESDGTGRLFQMCAAHGMPERLGDALRPLVEEAGRPDVVVDRDDEDCRRLKQQLESVAQRAGLRTRTDVGNSSWQLVNRIAVEELGRICYNTAYLLIVQWVPFGAVLFGGNAEQKARILPGLASGALRGAISITEPGAGSDLASLRTTAVLDGDHFVVNGHKVWTTLGHVAQYMILLARDLMWPASPPAQSKRMAAMF